MSPEHLSEALAAIRDDGIVALRQVVSDASIDALREKMLADLKTVEAARGIDKNYQGVRPPPFHPYLFRDILLNDIVISLTHALLGDGVYNGAYHANSSFPGSPVQHVHADLGHLFPGVVDPHPCCSAAINIPLCDTDERNGATEYWPGTHREIGPVYNRGLMISPQALEQRRDQRPPERMACRQGDVIVRDMRMWHRGVTNRSDVPRIMISMIQQSPWMAGGPIDFQKGSEEFLQHPVLATRAVFADPPIDYLYQGQNPNKKSKR